jgi:PAS domain S-box-containing protein/putative nucleotidyltransferase with HDIG domain
VECRIFIVSLTGASIVMNFSKYKMIFRVPLLYFIFAVIWITLSDQLVELISPDQFVATWLQTYKGWGFVVITSILLFFLLRREILIHDQDQERIGLIQNQLTESSIRFQVLFESSPIGIAVTNGDRIIYANPEFSNMFGLSPVADLEGQSLSQYINASSRDTFLQQYSLADQDLLKSVQFEAQGLKRDGSEISLMVQAGKIQSAPNNELVSFFVDLTHQKKTEQDLTNQVEKLNSLRSIDTAINFSLDLNLVLDTILQQVTSRLNVDAASIFLLQKDSNSLDHAAKLGFITESFYKTHIPIGEDPAGQVVLTRKNIVISDLRIENPFENKAAIIEEGFVSVYIVPLIAKGMVKGVLEVFHRSLLTPDDTWVDFLETLAGQTAIAIDASFVYDDLQRSNLQIMRAYEETIEGWSNALDMRDHETEGHTKRVTDLTMKLAKNMGLKPAELVHIQRGALLHDIGKMGIPDRILLKDGPLTEEERIVMDNHPTYAFQLLSPISYLRQAMEIPYCHHEHWDGGGYPRALRGEMIPLEARIFSVIDVFDALLSDRPYRKGLSEEAVLEYIRDHSGTQFDPQVVEAFLNLLKSERATFLNGFYSNIKQ